MIKGIAVLSLAFMTGCAGGSPKSPVQETAVSTVEAEFLSEPRVSYLGPAGTYTEEAALFFFPDAGEMRPKETVQQAIEEVKEGKADYAVIPQENTIGGAVVNYVDALIAEEAIAVTGEVILPISQTLMGIEGASLEDIRTVCSHAQGISQSKAWREEHLPDAEVTEMASTAAAAEYVSKQQDKTIAAIAAPGAAELYGLTVLAENVQITSANQTRFYVLAQQPLNEQNTHTRAVLVSSCEANQIDDIIVAVHNCGLELVAIHDRPEGSALGTYNYILEVSSAEGITQEQISVIRSLENVRLLGCFDAAEKTGAKK